MSHVTHMNKSCRTCDESCHTYEWVMSRIWMSHVTKESCHTYEWVMSQRSHVTHMNESCDESCCTYEWVILDRHSVINGPCNRCTRYARMSHATPVDLQAWRDSIIDATGLMEVWHASGTMRHMYRSLLQVSFHTYMSLLQLSFHMYRSLFASGTIRLKVRRNMNELIDVCHTSMSPK